MASKIQRLVSQARATFRKVGEEPSFSDEMKELKEVVRRGLGRRAVSSFYPHSN